MSKQSKDIIRCSLRLSEKQWGVLIKTLEAGKGPTMAATRCRRDADLVRYLHVKRAGLRVVHPGGRATSHLVRVRNLSSGGVGFIHGSFLYPDTACHVAIQTRHGDSVALAGAVTWCRHIGGKSHEIGLRFAQLIRIDEFVHPDVLDGSKEADENEAA